MSVEVYFRGEVGYEEVDFADEDRGVEEDVGWRDGGGYIGGG